MTAFAASMTAAVLDEIPAAGLDLRLVRRPRRAHPEDVLVAVEACGICGTDLHVIAGASYRPSLPFVLGHETVGRVVDAAPAEAGWIGRRVGISPFRGCGRCPLCVSGSRRLCERDHAVSGILDLWGGFSTCQLARVDQLVEVPEGVPATVAASVVDCGPTARNAAEVARASQPDTAVVIGAGAVGRLVVDELARDVAHTIVVEPSATRRAALAGSCGPSVRVVVDVEDVTQTADVVVECSGSPAVVTWALGNLAPRGTLVLAGYAHVDGVDFAPVARKELLIRGVRSGSTEHLGAVFDRVVTGAMNPAQPTVWALPDINDALDALRSEHPPAKAVIDCRGV